MNILFSCWISMCDKSRNTWLCVHWQWNTLEWCQLNALQASPVVHLMTPLSCVSLSMNTQPSVPTICTIIKYHAHTQHCFSSDSYCVESRDHYSDAMMGAMSSLITSLTSVYSTVHSCADQRKYQSSASLAFVWGIHRRPVNSPHKRPVMRKMFPFDDVIMTLAYNQVSASQFNTRYPLMIWPYCFR